MKEHIHILSVLAENNAGVLLRIAGLFSRRGYSIESISAAETENEHISRMTIVVRGSEDTLEQIEKQLNKLVDIKEVKVVSEETAVLREHVLIKAGGSNGSRSALMEAANLFRANVVDVSSDALILELTGSHRKISAFIKLIEPFRIMKLVRTGITALERD